MHHEERRFVGQSGLALNLQCADALLRRAGFPEGIRPVAQRNPAVFHYRADAHGILLFAAPASPQEPLVPFASLAVLHLVDIGIAAVQAARAGHAPTQRFDKLHGGKLVGARPWYSSDDCGLVGSHFSLSLSHDFKIIHYDTCVKYKVVAAMGIEPTRGQASPIPRIGPSTVPAHRVIKSGGSGGIRTHEALTGGDLRSALGLTTPLPSQGGEGTAPPPVSRTKSRELS